jgi:hypothetical protein
LVLSDFFSFQTIRNTAEKSLKKCGKALLFPPLFPSLGEYPIRNTSYSLFFHTGVENISDIISFYARG